MKVKRSVNLVQLRSLLRENVSGLIKPWFYYFKCAKTTALYPELKLCALEWLTRYFTIIFQNLIRSTSY